MKSFIKQILIFFLPLIFLSIVLDYIISNQLKKSNTHAFREYPVWNDIHSGNINADLLIMGSSRAWRHIDPNVLEDSLELSSYNLGMDGQHLPMQLWRYETLLKKNHAPRVIVYSLDFFMLTHTNELFNKDQFLPYLLFDFNAEKQLKDYIGFDYFDYRLPLIRYCGANKALSHTARISLLPKSNKKGRVKGFYAEDKKWNQDFEKVKAQMTSYNATIDATILIQFDQYIKKCKENKIQIVLVYSPEYFEGQNFVSNRKEVITAFEQLANQNEINFLNYSSDTISFQKSLFYNTTHLNKTGAELFSKKLASDLKSIIK